MTNLSIVLLSQLKIKGRPVEEEGEVEKEEEEEKKEEEENKLS